METLHQFVYDESFFSRNLNCIFFCEAVETLCFSIQNRFSLAIIVSFWITHIISLAGKIKIETYEFNKKLFLFVFPFPTVVYCFSVFAFLPGNAKNSWTGNLYRYVQPTKSYEVRSCKIYVPPLIYRLPSWGYKCVWIFPSESSFIHFSCSPFVKKISVKRKTIVTYLHIYHNNHHNFFNFIIGIGAYEPARCSRRTTHPWAT
jgi:hypothetical protein